jgi:predicted amidophosphoribosyltransferase
MTTPPPPPAEPEPSILTCSGDRVGLCCGCQRKTHKYGSYGSPLCQWCMAPVQSGWGSVVRFVNTRS